MKLISLEIDGFKSFAKKTIFELNKNIIAVVGPNGSGKSNIVDAIRWLLGEQSSKQIRVSDRTDVIFAGSNGYKKANSASVCLNIKKDDEVISIKKIISENTGNKYLINNKVTTLKGIHSIFSESAISTNLYSIVSQGQVSEIVNASHENLRDIVLSAANISSFIEKKKESLRMLEKTSENLERLNDMIYMIEKNLKSLSIKAGRAKKYLEYSDELKKLGKTFFGAKKYFILKSIEEFENSKKLNDENIKVLRSSSFEVEREYNQIKQEIEDVEKSLLEKSNMVQNHRERTLLLDAEKNRLSEKINEINSSLLSIDWEMKSLNDLLSKLNVRIEEVKDLEKKYFNDIEILNDEIKNILKEKENFEGKISEEEKEISKKEADLSNLEQQIKESKNFLNEKEKNFHSKEERIILLKEEKEKLLSDIKVLKKQLDRLLEIIESHSNEESDLSKKIKEKLDILRNLKEVFDKNIDYVEELKKEQINLKHTLQNLYNQLEDYSGYSSVIKTFFQKFKNDEKVIDVVANLVEVEKEYEEAVSASAGAKLQNIVIKDSDKVREYISYIRNNSYGKITFLPMDILKSKNVLNKNILNEPGTIEYLINIVNFESKFKTVMDYVFSNTLVVDSIESAVKLSKNFFKGNIVTLNGDFISGSGTITGGKNKNDYSTTILKRKREIEEIKIRLDEIQENFNYYNKEIEKLNKEITKEKNLYNDYKEKYNEKILQKNVENSNYVNINNEYKQKNNQLKTISERLDEYENDVRKLNQDILKLNKLIKDNSKEYEEISEKIKVISDKNTEIKNELSKINRILYEKNYSLDSIKEKYENYKNEKRKILKEISDSQDKSEIHQKSYDDLKIQKEKLNEKFQMTTKEYEFLNEELSKTLEVLKNSRTGKLDKMKHYENLENERMKLKDEINKFKEERQKIDFSIQELVHEQKFNLEKARQINLTEEDLELIELSEEEIDSLEIRLQDLENYLKKLGSVDLSVLEEYEQIQKDFDEKMIEKHDVEESVDKLNEIIQKLDELAESKYTSFFEKLNDEFKKFIQTLFKNGYGELNYIGEGKSFEKGIQISVKKYGNKFQKLSLFSGGEKALIAIAFLFAMMSLNPSPFYILDEIDAPLDDINASKISNLILKNAEKSQFLMITHNKLVMEIAEIFHGITMKDGVTRVVPVNFVDFQEYN